MDDLKYPDYIDLLKLKKEHAILEIAALALGVDPRYLKLKPEFDETKQCFFYDEDLSKYRWYIPLKAEQLDIDEYLDSEKDLLQLVPVEKLNQDLGAYSPSPKNFLYRELKSLLIEATKNGEIECKVPDQIGEEYWLSHISEKSIIKSESVKEWFNKHNFKTPFFEAVSNKPDLPRYLDKNHPEHSQELAIAIEAWQRFSDLDITHPKAYIEKWVEENFSTPKNTSSNSVKYHVSNYALDRILTMINWKTGGPKSAGNTAVKQDIYDKAIAKNLPR